MTSHKFTSTSARRYVACGGLESAVAYNDYTNGSVKRLQRDTQNGSSRHTLVSAACAYECIHLHMYLQAPQPASIEHPFIQAIAKDGRSYSRSVFDRAANLITRFAMKDADAIDVGACFEGRHNIGFS